MLLLLWLLLGCVCPHVAVRPAEAEAEAEKVPQPVVALEVIGEAPWQRGEVAALLESELARGWTPESAARWRSLVLETRRFRKVDVGADPVPGGVRIVVRLERKPLLRRAMFHGHAQLALRQLERAARLPVAAPVDAEMLAAAEQRLVNLYREEGFPDAQVRLEAVQVDEDEADVLVRIAEGEPRVVRRVEWSGLDERQRQLLERRFEMRLGQRWTSTLQKQTQRRALRQVRALGYLEARVDVALEPGGVVHLQVRPGPRCEVVFRGNRSLSAKALLALARIEDRLLITDATWRQLARAIEEEYQRKGHALVRVRPEIERPEPGAKRVTFHIDEGPKFRVRRVDFEGRRGVSAKRLRQVMVTGPPSWMPWRRGYFVQAEFEEDLRRLWFRYREFGYVDAEITDYRIEVERERRRIDVTIVVDEGRPVYISAVEFSGIPGRDRPPELEGVFVQAPLNPIALDRASGSLAAWLRDRGYRDAEVTADWHVVAEESERRLARVEFRVNPGPLYRIAAVQVQGNLQLPSAFVERETRLRPGLPLAPQTLADAQHRLYQSGLFRAADVDASSVRGERSPEGDAQATVVVRVEERAPITVGFGGGYNTRDGFRAFGELAHINVAHRGERLSVRGDVALDPAQKLGPNEYILDVGYRDPQWLDTGWSLRANAIGQRATRTIDQFSIERVAFVPALERRWLPSLLTGVEFQLEQARIFDLRPDARAFNPSDEGQLTTGSVGPFVVYEGRDDPFMPRRGVFESWRLRLAPGFLLSDEPFAKLQWHHSQYVPLSESLTFLYGIRGGWARTFSGRTVPIRERFFLGGRSTVRGFSENSIGPLGAPIVDPLGNRVFPGGNPLGGDLSLNVNTELRFPLVLGAVCAAFVDGGGVYLQERSVSVRDFRRSAGLGLLYETPIGPLALHYGVKLDRRRGESFGAVHFTIGTLF